MTIENIQRGEMKIYIETDLEGISGVLTWEQAGRERKGSEYEKARHLLTQDVNAAIEGALSAGADKILVMDGHGAGLNFVLEELHPEAEYITGPGRVLPYAGLDKSFDGVMLIGYHAMAGTKYAVLDHTQNSKTWFNYYLNGIKMGEIGQEAVVAGHFNIPVIFVSGDKAACEEAKALLGDVEIVAVKEGVSRTSARILSPVKARQLIEKEAAKAVKRIKDFKPYIMKPPVEIKIECQNTDVADSYERAGWKRIDGRTVTRVTNDTRKIL